MTILVTGGTGFVGSSVVSALGAHPLRLLVRNPTQENARLSPNIEIVQGDVTEPDSLENAVKGCDTIVHLVAIIEEAGGGTFDGVIRQGTVNVVNAAKAGGIQRLIHMSALGASDRPGFDYMQAKWRAEEAV